LGEKLKERERRELERERERKDDTGKVLFLLLKKSVVTIISK